MGDLLWPVGRGRMTGKGFYFIPYDLKRERMWRKGKGNFLLVFLYRLMHLVPKYATCISLCFWNKEQNTLRR